MTLSTPDTTTRPSLTTQPKDRRATGAPPAFLAYAIFVEPQTTVVPETSVATRTPSRAGAD